MPTHDELSALMMSACETSAKLSFLPSRLSSWVCLGLGLGLGLGFGFGLGLGLPP